jgi:hypothetical protein
VSQSNLDWNQALDWLTAVTDLRQGSSQERLKAP